MYEKLLVPLDGSELAEKALPYVEGIAKKLKSEAVLFNACPPGYCPERPMKDYLDNKAEELQSQGILASSLLVKSDAAEGILEAAERYDIGLIIISTHGLTGLTSWPVGIIASKVLRRSNVPTLLLRSSEREEVDAKEILQKILIPLDGSRFAESIIPFVEGLVEDGNSEIILLRVVEPMKLVHYSTYEERQSREEIDWERYEEEITTKLERAAMHYLTQKEKVLQHKGIKVSSLTLLGKPAQTILEYAEENSVSLIAIASHGLSGITKWAYGSIASKIIETSPKPVLLIRPPLTQIGVEPTRK